MKAPYVPLAVGLTLVSIACGDPSSTDPPAPCSADDECEGAARCVDGRCAPGMASSDAGPVASDAGPADMEACDGFDDDGDDLVDEGCACTVGSTQACRPWREGEAPPCALEGVQACEGAEFGEWGACEVPPPDPASELCPTWILGADVDDQLTAARGAGIGDLDHDGDPELLAPSMRGDGSGTNDGVTYVIGGGPDLQGRTIDLRTDAPEARIQGASFGQEAHLADVDGDGYLDVVRGTGGRAALVAYGDASLPVLLEAVDGTRLARLTGGGASSGEASWMVGDMDGDGRAEVFMSGANSTLHGGTSHGLSYWSGQARSAEIAPSGVVGIEIGTVGVATQANNTNGGGAGDFDADGYLDITANRGAANDGMYIPYVVRVVDGRSSGGWSSMSEGLGVSGGTGFGVWASLQNGDVDGDGTDDLVLLGHGRRHVYVVYGGADLATSLATGSLDAAGFVVHSDELRPDVALGVGDLDGDGADDLVIPLESADADLVIVWGGARRTGELDPIEPESTHIALPAHDAVMDLGERRDVTVGDLDGDGLGDIVVGFADAATRNGARSGAGVVLFGNRLYGAHNPALAMRRRGTTALEATMAPDRMASGLAGDVVRGVGAGDVVLLGAGDDRVEVTDPSVRRVDGGPGVDTVALLGDVTLDLGSVGARAWIEIERFDLSAPGGQTLAARDGDLSGLSTRTRTFEVRGDALDQLVLGGAWDVGTPESGLAVYTRGALRVEVSAEVMVTIVP